MTTIGKKKKLNRADYMFKDRVGETLMKKPGDINGIEFAINNLENCEVSILDHTAQVSTPLILALLFCRSW